MKQMMTKKNILLLGLGGSAFFLIGMFPVEVGICGQINYSCRQTLELTQMIFGIFPIIFLLSLVTYKMHEEVFTTWKRFSIWFVPISILLILSMSSGGGSWGVGFGNEQEILAIFFSIAYSLVSLVLIAYKFFTLKKRGEGK